MIDVQHLTYTYAGRESPAVKDCSFQIAEGEIVGFLGPSGAGKSTTQKILIGLLDAYEGQITVMGRDLPQWGPDYYEQVGVSFELPNHFLKLTARENLHYFRALYAGSTEKPETMLDWVGLLPDADIRVAEYSKGMRNRLTVARALMHKPRLLFLDEPTAGLDPINARQIQTLIRTQQEQGTTVFLTTHNMAVADALCDRVAFIVEGEIALIDAPRALRLKHGRRNVSVQYIKDGQPVTSEFPLDGLADHPDFLPLLREATIQTIHTQETTLEDIFIQVTGRALA